MLSVVCPCTSFMKMVALYYFYPFATFKGLKVQMSFNLNKPCELLNVGSLIGIPSLLFLPMQIAFLWVTS